MNKIDPRLKFLREQGNETLSELEPLGRFGLEMAEVPSPQVKVLVQYTGDLADIEAQGFETRTVAGDVATGMVGLRNLDGIVGLANVVRIESSRPMASELNDSLPEIRADVVHTGPPGHQGTGVIVGIIDTGIDVMHQSFREPDGTSRILAIWDQWLAPHGSESSPSGYTYGVEYTKSDINASIAAGGPPNGMRHTDGDVRVGHGTHVAGIAAGDGSVAGNDQPAFTFVGVAPEADIIVVLNRAGTEALGDSANTLDGINYIFSKAAALNKPAVINLSQGDNLGPHDGTSLLERGIDNLLGGQGRAMVKSAGNEGSKNRHASGTVSTAGTETVRFAVPSNDADPDTIDIWYAGSDRFGITVTTPDGDTSTTVNPGNTANISLPNGNRAFIDSVVDDPNNHDNRIYIQLSPGTSPTIQPGTWSFNLIGNTVVRGRFDAWIERGSPAPEFIGTHRDRSMTISIPGTSREVITAASYTTKGAGIGSIASYSSRGPTRDGRTAPTVAAPGRWVMSARARGILNGSDQYHLLSGTSMAAPHVTGTIALLLQRNPELTQAQIRNLLVNSARSDTFTGTVPNNTWGHGKLDAKGAFDAVSPAEEPVVEEKPRFRWGGWS
jgi:subtilisin family serine protease